MATSKANNSIFKFSWPVFWSTTIALTVATLIIIPQVGKLINQAMKGSNNKPNQRQRR